MGHEQVLWLVYLTKVIRYCEEARVGVEQVYS